MLNPRLAGLFAYLTLAPIEYRNLSDEEYEKIQKEIEEDKRLKNMENQITRNKQKLEKQNQRRRF